jgi:hypothetical protein
MLLSRGARLALALHYLSWALYLLVVLPGALAATPSKRSANVSITFTPDLSRAAVVDAEFQGLSVQYQSVRRPLTSPVYRYVTNYFLTGMPGWQAELVSSLDDKHRCQCTNHVVAPLSFFAPE